MKRYLIVLYILISGMPALAQTASETENTYSLKGCLQKGLEKNYSIRLIKNEERISNNNANPANAGLLPNVDVNAGYSGDYSTTRTTTRITGETSTQRNAYDQNLNAGIDVNWTLFDGFSLITNYKQLQLLKKQGELQTRLTIEDFISGLAAEYYNFVQQKIRLKNFRYAMSLSKERMRIVEERYNIGNFSRLDYQQAKVDFNADSAQYMKQQEALKTSGIRLNELMANEDVSKHLIIRDTLIEVSSSLNFNQLWKSTLAINASLLQAEQHTTLAQMDLKKVLSRNYPYVKVKVGYGYTLNKYELSSTSKRNNWGMNAGLTVGFSLYDGSRATQRKNAQIAIENSRLQRQELELGLNADMNNLWQAYQNNLQVLQLEQQNLLAARENYEIAYERYLLGDLSGFEMREAQKSLLDAEERLLTARYDTKMCEISLLQLSGNIMFYLQ